MAKHVILDLNNGKNGVLHEKKNRQLLNKHIWLLSIFLGKKSLKPCFNHEEKYVFFTSKAREGPCISVKCLLEK